MGHIASPDRHLTQNEIKRYRDDGVSTGDSRRPLSRAFCLALSFCTALALSACHSVKVASAPPVVVVAVPLQPDADAGSTPIHYPVEVAARYSNPMSFRVSGKVIERKVRLGDRVRQGEVVARLDPSDPQKESASAQAALERAEHNLLFAKQQLDRDTAQAAQNLIAAKQLEQSLDAFSSARATRDQAAEQLGLSKDHLEYTTLTADHDGVITSENADTGQVVTAGQAIYGLAWSGDVDVILDAAPSNLGRIAIGQVASITFPTLPGRSFQARVREIAAAADSESRTYRVKLTLVQPEPAIALGMTGQATLSPAALPDGAPPRGSTFTVPSTAIFHQGNAPAVWVVAARNSTLELRPVTVRSYGDHSSVVSAGLQNGDTVVLAGAHTVYAGEHVTPVRPLFDDDGEVAGPAPSGSPPGDPKYGPGGRVGAGQ
jgi:RND family efflux transporter MFP subunit